MLENIKNLIPVIEKNDNGYWEIYKDNRNREIKRIWHERGKVKEDIDFFEEETGELEINNNKMKFKSKEQLDQEAPKFALLPQDDYGLIVTEVKEDKRNKYMAKPDKDGNIPQEEIVNITLEITGLKDGSEPQDADGQSAVGRKAFFTLRPGSMGFMRDGTPAKSRCFIAFATGQEVEGELELENFENLVGKTIYAEIVQYTNQKGQKANKISRILPPPKRKK